jgi:hypothetical protein
MKVAAIERRWISMHISSDRAASLKHKAVMELKLFAVISAYLFITLSAFTIHTAMVAATHAINPAQFGYNAVEALILGKVILIGDALRIGKRFSSRPVIVATLYNALAFSIFIFIFSVLEHLVEGLIHREGLSEIVQKLVQKGTEVILARAGIMFLTFIPFFALWEVGRTMGEGRMIEMLFVRRRAAEASSAGE